MGQHTSTDIQTSKNVFPMYTRDSPLYKLLLLFTLEYMGMCFFLKHVFILRRLENRNDTFINS